MKTVFVDDFFGLKDKVVLITGANNPHGIGASMGRVFAKHGSKVFLHGFKCGSRDTSCNNVPGEKFYSYCNSLSIDGVIEDIRRLGNFNVAGVEGDISEEGFIKILFDSCEKTLGGVDILINNAAAAGTDGNHEETAKKGVANQKNTACDADTILNSSAATFNKAFFVNARGTLLLMREFANRFISRGAKNGSIVNLSSDGAHGPFPGEVSYGASKYAVESFTASAAYELGQYGIRVNVISPGPTQTGWIGKEFENQLKQSIPLGRIGDPKEIADAVIFMASSQARWITGQILWVNGGFRM